MPGQHGTSLSDYTEALKTQLRLRDILGAVIGEIVAEVESHVRETGEDPVEAFGQPGNYSTQFASGRRPGADRGWSTLASVVVTAGTLAGSVMFVEGVLNLAGEARVTANALLFWAAVGLMFFFVVRPLALATIDRETRTVTEGRRAQVSRAAYWWGFLVLMATIELSMAIRSRAPEGPVFLRLPGGVLLLVGLALTGASVWVLLRRSDRIVDPRASARRNPSTAPRRS